ncbi:MAG: histidinol phosphate phosphatase [Candidatus Rokubacteria bacterium]|nr:histidinol phosphate phosphatase [Candidatus Rokubacteria bacterium]
MNTLKGTSERVLAVMIEAARVAGDIAMRYYRDGVDVVLKPDQTPVTQADREAEQAIVKILTTAFPGVGILGEEFGGQGSKDRRFIIDPIDGTKNFIRHIPVWATLIGYEENGAITAGVMHNPATAELLSARRGAGASLNGRRVHVSDVNELHKTQLIHAGLDILRASGHWDNFVRLVDASDRQRGFGDFMGYSLVAEGKADIYLEADLKPWDLAACKIVIEEAGGRFTDWEGKPTIYSGTALATNGRVHDAVLALLNG